MSADAHLGPNGWCTSCGKRTHPTRKAARRARRTAHAAESGMRAYRCPTGPGFHLGHNDVPAVALVNLNAPRLIPTPRTETLMSAAEAMRRMAQTNPHPAQAPTPVPDPPTEPEPAGIRSETTDVTPELAREWLGHNELNRPKKNRKIEQYARDMAAGKWQLTGEAVKFDTTGRLVDGQNRLHAVVQSGATVTMLVVTGVQPEAQRVMDTGAARSAGDSLALLGLTNTTVLASAARIAMAIRDEEPIRNARYTTSEIQEFVEANLDLADVWAVLGKRHRQMGLTPSVAWYCGWRLARVDAQAAATFFEQLGEGVGLTAGSPILALKRRLTGNYGAPRQITPDEQVSVVMRAWNMWRDNSRVERVPTMVRGGVIRIPVPH